jgi:hypothetical protein
MDKLSRGFLIFERERDTWESASARNLLHLWVKETHQVRGQKKPPAQRVQSSWNHVALKTNVSASGQMFENFLWF